MNTPITTASVKVMRSHDYCHFEVALGCSHDDNGNPIPLTNGMVDDLHKQAARLADKAVEQYKIAKQQRETKEHLPNSSEGWEAKRIRAKAEGDRTPNEMAALKAYEDAVFRANRGYDYQDDWQEDEAV